ncbi:MAG TPA: SEC-C metal-binding domain-containing protein [Bacteriovoracaceae bacterium]|nr:SEC-C metal-binding domain-containing protein [Bacteriovoracaceae bacterium]
MSITRNDPCPCGSGLKYKKCCLNKGQPSPDEFKRKRWGAIQSGLVKKLLEHIGLVYGSHAIQEAWDEFHCFENDDDFNPHSPELPLFMPWFFYEWYPDDDNLELLSPALSLLKSRKNLSADEKDYLQICCETSFSFFEVIEVVRDKSLTLNDILKEERQFILEKSATSVAKPGDIIFGKVLQIEGIGVLEACSSIIIRPQMKLQVLKLRKWLLKENDKIDNELLHDFAFEIMEQYQEIYEYVMNPPRPVITNTDGNLLIPHKLIFQINDPKDTFEALHGLCINSTREELLQAATFDKKGELHTVGFPWLKKGNKKNKGWDNTVFGQIKIESTKLTVEVNSKERAQKFKVLIKKLMPAGQKFQASLIESLESMEKNDSGKVSDNNALMEKPEVIAQLEKMMMAHWDNWIHETLPALDGLRPIDAAKTKDGREALKSLLNQFERDFTARPIPGQTVETVLALRSKLGL